MRVLQSCKEAVEHKDGHDEIIQRNDGARELLEQDNLLALLKQLRNDIFKQKAMAKMQTQCRHTNFLFKVIQLRLHSYVASFNKSQSKYVDIMCSFPYCLRVLNYKIMPTFCFILSLLHQIVLCAYLLVAEKGTSFQIFLKEKVNKSYLFFCTLKLSIFFNLIRAQKILQFLS